MEETRLLIISFIATFVILMPLFKKCEFRFKNSIIISLIVAILTFFSTMLTNYFFLIFPFLYAGFIILYKFYRDPKRIPPKEKNIIVSPADGFIKYIKLDNNNWRIGITITYIDVHINRSPISGKITGIKFMGNKFWSLKRKDAIEYNRQAIIDIKGDINIRLYLIASRIVRKIILYIKEDDEIKIGQKIGKITLGSQVDIILPSIVKIKIKEKEQVYAGTSIIATY